MYLGGHNVDCVGVIAVAFIASLNQRQGSDLRQGPCGEALKGFGIVAGIMNWSHS